MTESLKTIVINSTPTFLLRKVNPSEVIQNYNSGKYSQLVLNKTTKTEIRSSQTAIGSYVAGKQDGDVYGYRNKGNNVQVIATTDCKPYVEFISNETGAPIMGGRCKWCRREFTQQAIGVPIKSVRMEGKIVVYYSGVACKYGCAYSLWKQQYGMKMLRRDSQFLAGEMILKYLYSLQYPGREIKEAADPELLKSNGGSLDDDEYDNSNYTYIPTNSFVWAPVKSQHLRYSG
jgi:hypothetical protein